MEFTRMRSLRICKVLRNWVLPGRLRKPLGVMVSSPDQTPQVPFMFFLIIHYFERPAPSVRLVKSIHLRACCKYWLVMCVLAFLEPIENITCNFCPNSIYFTQKKQHLQVLFVSHKEELLWNFYYLSRCLNR